MTTAKKGKAKMQLTELLSRHSAGPQSENIDFRSYFELVQQNPAIAQLSHARMYAMLTEGGQDAKDFFKHTIFGVEKSLDEFISVMRAAAQRTEIRKRILLLMGPPGAGKSTLVALIKKGLASYTARNPLYAIAFCPIQEEPLHLLPESSRDELEAQGIYVEGGLCPFCTKKVAEDYTDITSVPVRQLSLSESMRQGIGTFSASDSKNQSVDDLIGSVNISKLVNHEEADPYAYSYNGEILISNRGALELIEMFKANAELLYELLNVTQEQQVKLTKLPMCPVDLVLLAHTNEAEFEKFLGDRKNEALRDRIYPIRVPYTLAVDDEIKIYRRLLKAGTLEGIHIPETAVKVAAQFAIVTRLTESDRIKVTEEGKSGLIKKMKLYNGEAQTGYTAADVKALHEESEAEGMFGVGPRQIINWLSQAATEGKKTCMTPITTLKAIRDGIKGNIQLHPEERKVLEARLSLVVEHFRDEIKTDVQKGYVHGFSDVGNDMFVRYIENVEAFLNDEKIKNPITDVDEEPNERFMRRVEEMIKVSENQARAFRTEIATKMGAALRAGRKFDYQTHPALKEAIEAALFSDLKDAIAITTSRSQDPDTKKRFNDAVASLVENGWCAVCAEESINYVSQQLV